MGVAERIYRNDMNRNAEKNKKNTALTGAF